MDEEQFFAEEINQQQEYIPEVDYDDYPEFDSIEYTTDW